MKQYWFNKNSLYARGTQVLFQLTTDPMQYFPQPTWNRVQHPMVLPTLTQRSIIYPLIHAPGLGTIDNNPTKSLLSTNWYDSLRGPL